MPTFLSTQFLADTFVGKNIDFRPEPRREDPCNGLYGGGGGLPLKGVLFSVFRYIEEYRIHELGKSFIKVFGP